MNTTPIDYIDGVRCRLGAVGEAAQAAASACADHPDAAAALRAVARGVTAAFSASFVPTVRETVAAVAYAAAADGTPVAAALRWLAAAMAAAESPRAGWWPAGWQRQVAAAARAADLAPSSEAACVAAVLAAKVVAG